MSLVLLVVVVAGGACRDRASDPHPPPAAHAAGAFDALVRELSVPGRFSPPLTALFAPRPSLQSRYAIYVSDAPLDATRLAVEAIHGQIEWHIERVDALDAFDPAARFDRWTLPRLYGGIRPLVVLGHVRHAAQIFSLTLVSPHPDERLASLKPGTMVVVFAAPEVPGAGPGRPH